jgi:hypothetical protein
MNCTRLTHLLLTAGLTLAPQALALEYDDPTIPYINGAPTPYVVDLKTGEELVVTGLRLDAMLGGAGKGAEDVWIKGLWLDVLPALAPACGVGSKGDANKPIRLDLAEEVASDVWVAQDTLTGSMRVLDTANLDLGVGSGNSFHTTTPGHKYLPAPGGGIVTITDGALRGLYRDELGGSFECAFEILENGAGKFSWRRDCWAPEGKQVSIGFQVLPKGCTSSDASYPGSPWQQLAHDAYPLFVDPPGIGSLIEAKGGEKYGEAAVPALAVVPNEPFFVARALLEELAVDGGLADELLVTEHPTLLGYFYGPGDAHFAVIWSAYSSESPIAMSGTGNLYAPAITFYDEPIVLE